MLIRAETDRSKIRTKPRLSHDRRIFLLALLAGGPAVATALILIWTGSFTTRSQWTLTIVIVGFWLAVVSELRQRVVFPSLSEHGFS